MPFKFCRLDNRVRGPNSTMVTELRKNSEMRGLKITVYIIPSTLRHYLATQQAEVEAK